MADAPQPADIAVVLADDHAMVRKGLRLILDGEPGVRVVAEAGDIAAARAAVTEHRPRVAVLDLNMPGGDTIAAIPALLAAAPESAIVVLTMEDDPLRARAAIAAGASAFVLKDDADSELMTAVRAAAAGGTYLNPRLGAQLARLPLGERHAPPAGGSAEPSADEAAPAGATPDGELASGTLFAGHRIDSRLGTGGMAVVYRATDVALDRPVALKVLAHALARDAVFRERFESECRLAASIHDPHVVPIYRAGEEHGRLFLTMRLVEGDDLRSLLAREGRLDPARAVALTAQVAMGLEAAHRRGLVHRDIKPGNVLVEHPGAAEHAYVADFGLSLDRSRARHLTATGFAIGTADYMSPEQARGADVDPRSDVYSLGCVLYRALTGTVPYERTSEVETLWAHLHEPPPRITDVAPDVPGPLADVLERTLAKEPGDRPQTAAALRDALLAAGTA